MYMLTIILLTLRTTNVFAGILGDGRKQSVAVSGHLLCNEKPAANIRLKLYDKEILLDYKLDEGKTDSSGAFYLRGSKKEITNIDPKLNIYHKCNYSGPCVKKLSIIIPDEYITESSTPQLVFNIGTINLAGMISGEEIDCIN
ncbi:unnamed protein product [Cylicocyclus nassatus]|uniref:Transthyretin-like family protein n=1 Tax=Cylicocyclus nassatus TaxID=53992 RepID=A0AA36MAI0_CYLNA|nr:unnamed protein product [Cylicocyclus nassatus]